MRCNALSKSAFPVKPLAIFWLLVCVWVAGYNFYFWRQSDHRIETNILALLPSTTQNPAEQRAVEAMAQGAAQKVVVLLGGRDWDTLKQAQDQYLSTVNQPGIWQKIEYQVNQQTLGALLQLYTPVASHLLTDNLRQRLQTQSAEVVAAQMWQALNSPVNMPRLLPWQTDPLNLFGQWLHERSRQMNVQPYEGRLALQDDQTQTWYTVMLFELQGSPFSIASQEKARTVLEAADAGLHNNYPQISVYKAGIVLHADKATAQAEKEVSLIGTGSLVGIILLMIVVFRSVRPVVLVVISLLVGTAGGLAVSALLFEKLHILTLVFGSSLIGVAEDFGIHYLCNRLNRAPDPKGELMRHLLLSLFLAMLTTAIGYMAMSFTPLPGLQQMAVFSASGLFFAWMTVVCWFPWLDRGKLCSPAWINRAGEARQLWPYVGNNRFTWLGLAVCCVVIAAGGYQLRVNDDLLQLQSADPDLVAQQIKISQRLHLPGAVHFFLVRGMNGEQVLQREEAFRARLDQAIHEGLITGYQSVSQWVPSQQRQRQDEALLRTKLYGKEGALAVLARQQVMHTMTMPLFQAITIDAWLQSPISEAARHLWLGQVGQETVSVISLQGLSADALPAMATLGTGFPGVTWVNHIEQVSGLLGTYRLTMSKIIIAGFVLVFCLLLPIFRRRTWRVLAPTALSSLLTLALLSLAGIALNLFHILAFLMILGLGVDFAIFLESHRDEPKAMIAITMGAAGTLLSFGLLALSQTPALFSFGLTVLIGLILVWLVSPSFSSRGDT